MILRDWQQEAFSNYNQALRQGTRSLLWEAAPGAGKTNAALAVCRDQLHRRGRRRVIVVVPTRHLTAQWATAARRWHIHLHHGRDVQCQCYICGVEVTIDAPGASPAGIRMLQAWAMCKKCTVVEMAVAYVTARQEARVAYQQVGQDAPSGNYLAAITESAMQPLRVFLSAANREESALQSLACAVRHFQDSRKKEEEANG